MDRYLRIAGAAVVSVALVTVTWLLVSRIFAIAPSPSLNGPQPLWPPVRMWSVRAGCPVGPAEEFYFPPGIPDPTHATTLALTAWYAENLSVMGEPSLSCGDAPPEVFRLTILPSFSPATSVRLTRERGAVTLALVRLSVAIYPAPPAPPQSAPPPPSSGQGRDRGRVRREGMDGTQWSASSVARRSERPVAETEWRRLTSTLAESAFWQMPGGQELRGVDGTYLIIEARRGNAYHVVSREYNEAGTRRFKEACLALLQLAGVEWR